MVEKYLNTNKNEYSIFRDEKDNDSMNNIISIQIIKDSIKALETLLDIKEYKIIIRGNVGTYSSYKDIEVLKLNKSTIEIMDYTEKSGDEKVNVKIKVNEVEEIDTFERDKDFKLIKDKEGMLIPKVDKYYSNFIDRVVIEYK